MFSCEFCKNFNSTCFTEYLQTTPSAWRQYIEQGPTVKNNRDASKVKQDFLGL